MQGWTSIVLRKKLWSEMLETLWPTPHNYIYTLLVPYEPLIRTEDFSPRQPLIRWIDVAIFVRWIYFRSKKGLNEFDAEIIGRCIDWVPLTGCVEPGVVFFEFPRIDEWRMLRCVHVEIKIFLFKKITRRCFVDQRNGFQSIDALLKLRISDLTLKKKFRVDRCPQFKSKGGQRARIRTWTGQNQRFVTVISVHRFFLTTLTKWMQSFVLSRPFMRLSSTKKKPQGEEISSSHFNDRHDENVSGVIPRIDTVNHSNNKQKRRLIAFTFSKPVSRLKIDN